MDFINDKPLTQRDDRNTDALTHIGHDVSPIGASDNNATRIPHWRVERQRYLCKRCGVIFTVYNWVEYTDGKPVQPTQHH